MYDPKNYKWRSSINYRQHPEKYLVGKGEEGVLLCEPYKSEILPFWKFRSPKLLKKVAVKYIAYF
jgi:hypothetical protein